MIIKTIFYFASLFVVALLVVKGVQNPGELTIEWFGYYVEVNVMFAIVMILAFIFLVQMMMHVLTLLGFLPSVIKYKSENKKLKTGLENLKSIALSLSLGNKKQAEKLAKKNQKILPEYPVFDEMLDIKSKNDLSNDIIDLRLAKEKVDEFLTNYDDEKALKIVENILKQHPDSAWAKQKQYVLLLRLSEFDSALKILTILKKEKLISKEQFNMENAFIHYELALNENDPIQALKLAETGMKSQSNFIKLVEFSASTLVQTTEKEKALKLLISMAKNFNHCLATIDSFRSIIESLEVAEQIKWLDKYAKISSYATACNIAKAQSLVLQEKQEEAIAYLDNADKTKESLLVLSQIHKNIGDNIKSIKCLELANNIDYLAKEDLVAEYKLWQVNNLVVKTEAEQLAGSNTTTESLLLK